MPFGEVKLIPGVNTERTPTLYEAGIVASQLIRFRDGLAQKYGGWQKFYPNAVPGKPRDLHAWEDLNQTNHLSVGTTTQLAVITSGSYQDITPQALTSDFAPALQATSGSPTITITDPNIANVTVYDAVLFNTPISVGGIILSGLYAIVQITGTTSYDITAASNAVNTNSLTTNNTTAAGNNTLHIASVPSWVIDGMQIVDLTTPSAIPANTVVSSTTGSTIVMSNNAAGAGVGNGDTIVITSLPSFTTTNGSAIVQVNLVGHGLTVGVGIAHQINFPIATTGNGVTISGTYTMASAVSANAFNITASNQASASSTFSMNSGNCELVYYINLGPPAVGSGYGLGGYGAGGYGTGAAASSTQTGTEITATDWTTDNWGEILMVCPAGGGVYQFDPTGGFKNAGLVSSAPVLNGGLFVSMALQILVCWGSTQALGIGIERDPLLIKWSDQSDYTDFVPLPTNQAGSERISIGSTIRGGMAVMNQNLIWTDLDLWAMNYLGPPFVFGFNKIGAGAGAISSHAMQQLRNGVYWMGASNFYGYTANGVNVLPCPVWDFVFQNMNTAFSQNVRVLPNTPFNEAGWAFPSSASANGECDSYVKTNVTEPGGPWDYGSLARSAWMDQTILGPPIGATPTGIIYQHETTNDADGAVLAASFTTGYFYIAEGEDFAFIDQIYPDFKWGTFAGAQGAQIQISVNVVNFPGDTPTVYGPFTVTQSTQYISVRIRGRQMSFTVASNDVGSFWRLGKVRYRYAPDGRR